MSRRLGVLLVGRSGLGVDQDHQSSMYEPAFSAHPGFEVVGSDDSVDAITRDDVDVVSVCVPMQHRIEIVTAALRAGKHVLVDKPMSTSAADCAAIAAAARDAGRICMPAHHLGFHPMIASARDALSQGTVGLPWNIQADLFVAGGTPVDTGELDNFAVYPLDVVLGFTGQPVHRVHARSATLRENGETEDLAILMLDHEHGLTSTITVGRLPALGGLEPGAVAVHRYRVSGSHGVLDVDATKPALTVHNTSGAAARWHGPSSVERMLDELYAAITGGRTPRPGPAEAEHVAMVLEAAHTSINTGQPVPTPIVRTTP